MIMSSFIKTNDDKSAEKLRSLNFQELPKNGDYYVFIYKDKVSFADIDHLIFTNLLYT